MRNDTIKAEELANMFVLVVRGQKLEKLLSNHEAQNKGTIVVFLLIRINVGFLLLVPM